ncbi:MAG: 4-amino-4-deoxy-L-arabinose transferase-like glycosyltransferase [Paraglaciecola sp.]|uniref:glycosyltransferase family 39 protein n=1 Tax=Polaribacter sp. TaxID=1920175 RepID=UPI003EE8D8D7
MNYLSKYFTTKAISIFFIVLIAITLLAFQYSLPIQWIFTASSTVFLFFLYGNKLTRKWAITSSASFKKNIFYSALAIRILWVVGSYFLYQSMTGQPFEFEAADSTGYHFEAVWMRSVIANGNYDFYLGYYMNRLSDMGYPAYLTFIYTIFGDSIIIARLIKAILGAVTVLFIYKIASRNFGEATGRVAGVLAMLYPNLIYYAGLHTKETEMVFLLVLFIERADHLFRKNKLMVFQLLLVLFLGSLLYFFRAVLFYTAFLSLGMVVLFSSQRALKFRKTLLVVFFGIITFLFINNSFIIDEASGFLEDSGSNQSISLQHRSTTQKLAKYGSTAIFAPIIFIGPFPTFVNIETQQNHMLLSGGYFVKNIMAFFVFVAFLFLIKKKRWKNHILILSIFLIYLAILTMSKFAIVERFHMPALPLFIILAAFGIAKINKKNIKYFQLYLVVIIIVIVGWNWFKLVGRGLI